MNKSEKIKVIDTMVGKSIADRRRLLGLSQQDLAKVASVSVQQIQKYERSTNRVTCGKLYQFAKILKVSIEYFFEGIDDLLNKKSDKDKYEENRDFAISSFQEEQAKFEKLEDYNVKVEKEVFNLVKSYNSIPDKQIRKRLLELLKSISNAL